MENEFNEFEEITQPSLAFRLRSFFLENTFKIMGFLGIIIMSLFIINLLPKQENSSNKITDFYSEKGELVIKKAVITSKIKKLQEERAMIQSGILKLDTDIQKEINILSK